MRIIAGRHRGRSLLSPATDDIRPTSDRVRQAIFNIIEHAEFSPGLEEALVLDAFAGSGAMGLEALSRGAARAVFFDRDRQALDLAKQNAIKVGELAASNFFNTDAAKPPRATQPARMIFLDPPYRANLTAPVWEALAETGWLNAETLVIAETTVTFSDAVPETAELLDSRRYGATLVRFLKLKSPDST